MQRNVFDMLGARLQNRRDQNLLWLRHDDGHVSPREYRKVQNLTRVLGFQENNLSVLPFPNPRIPLNEKIFSEFENASALIVPHYDYVLTLAPFLPSDTLVLAKTMTPRNFIALKFQNLKKVLVPIADIASTQKILDSLLAHCEATQSSLTLMYVSPPLQNRNPWERGSPFFSPSELLAEQNRLEILQMVVKKGEKKNIDIRLDLNPELFNFEKKLFDMVKNEFFEFIAFQPDRMTSRSGQKILKKLTKTLSVSAWVILFNQSEEAAIPASLSLVS